ncbi:MAG: LacI family DNA-binding transcriptional regulator [Nocardioidaceae bacterium]|nr:LacI family DNA-binding transcriptional regulator [Nocardioidaceae bacterium]
MPNVRLRDVAERAGVSVRTVSNVVNDFAHVAPATRERVHRAIDELGYRPNFAARQLRQGRTGVISLVVAEIDSPYFAELASVVVRVAESRGWDVHIDQTDGDPDRERRMLSGPLGQQVDGVIFSPWALAPAELTQRAPSTPLVVLGERQAHGQVDHVAVDNVAAAHAATAHLIDSGRQHIVAVGLQPHLSNETALLRQRGYHRALAAAGRSPDPRREIAVERLHRSDGAQAVARLLQDGTTFDSLFCFTDQLALGAIRALADQGLKVPDDVAVVGFDDIEDGRYAVPSLSTVAPDKRQIAEVALQLLEHRIQDPAAPVVDFVAAHELLIRQSSSPVTINPRDAGVS